jgi:pimeloyl-ACP methyl ester carboxylesterase
MSLLTCDVSSIPLGLCSYVSFLNSLYQKSRKTNRPIILIELPHISMSLFCQRPFHTTPFTMSSTLAVVDEIFDRHQLKKSATVVGHSLGTIVAGWIIKERPNLVDRTVLIDPVCFQLYEAYLCQNFVYKMPTTGFELVLWYFIAKEACIAWYLGRWFWW